MQAQTYHNLDIMRAYAVLAVVFAHLWRYFGDTLLFGKLELSHMFGLLGVTLFFVHTSLVLMFSLQRQAKGTGEQKLMRKFYLRRAFRIYPLSIFTVVMIWMLDLPLARLGAYSLQTTDLSSFQVLANIGLFQNIYHEANILGPLWSLPVEVQMYIVLPFLYMAATSKRALWMIVALCGLSLPLVTLVKPLAMQVNQQLLPYQIPSLWMWVPCFLPGILAFVLWKRAPKFLPWYSLPALLAFVSGLNFLSYRMELIYFICLIIGASLPFIKDCGWPVLRRVSSTIAEYSYSIYLLHYVAMYVAFEALAIEHIGLQLLMFIAILSGLCYVTYNFIEMPMVKWGKKLTRHQTGQMPPQNLRPAA